MSCLLSIFTPTCISPPAPSPATPTHHYVPNAYYASQMHAGAAHMHVVAPSTVRQDPAAQRKRPKYTRSKTGCLTCRAKKIKVSLMRWRPPRALPLTLGYSATRRNPLAYVAVMVSERYVFRYFRRVVVAFDILTLAQCTWPEGVPSRKKPTPRREPPSPIDGVETRPSTAGSSGMSEAATPPTRGPTPPRRGEPVEMGIPPMVSRRHRCVRLVYSNHQQSLSDHL